MTAGMKADLVEYQGCAPNAPAMVEPLTAHGHTLPTAILDLVNNSIAVGRRNDWLRFERNEGYSWISLTDEFNRASESEIRSAFLLGSRSPVKRGKIMTWEASRR